MLVRATTEDQVGVAADRTSFLQIGGVLRDEKTTDLAGPTGRVPDDLDRPAVLACVPALERAAELAPDLLVVRRDDDELGRVLRRRGGVGAYQQRRRDLEASLEHQEAIAQTKDEFIANLSHELRTPLTGIYGFALELIDGGHDPSMSLELARLIAGQSAELSRMVEDLLALNTVEHNELVVNLEVVDPKQEIADVLEPLSRTGIIAVAQAETAGIEVDALRLRQVVRNLISNAHRHGGPRRDARPRHGLSSARTLDRSSPADRSGDAGNAGRHPGHVALNLLPVPGTSP